MSPDSLAFFVVAIVVLILAIGMDIACVYLMKIHKRRWYVVFPLLLWSIHLTIFYAFAVYAYSINSNLATLFHIEDAGEIWSSIQRLHGVITVFYLTYILHIEMTT